MWADSRPHSPGATISIGLGAKLEVYQEDVNAVCRTLASTGGGGGGGGGIIPIAAGAGAGALLVLVGVIWLVKHKGDGGVDKKTRDLDRTTAAFDNPAYDEGNRDEGLYADLPKTGFDAQYDDAEEGDGGYLNIDAVEAPGTMPGYQDVSAEGYQDVVASGTAPGYQDVSAEGDEEGDFGGFDEDSDFEDDEDDDE